MSAVKNFYLSVDSPYASGLLSPMYESQHISRGSTGPYAFTVRNSDTINYYNDYTSLFFNLSAYPTVLTSKSSTVFPTKLTGTFLGSDWTVIASHNLSSGPPIGNSYQAHLVVRFFAVRALTLAGVTAARLLSATAFHGTVATIGVGIVGTSLVTATMPQVILNDEYLCVDLTWQLDSVFTGPNPTTSTLMGNPATSSSRWTQPFLTTGPFTTTIPQICDQLGLHSAERYSYITPSGTEYPLDVPKSRAVISSEGEGLPPINYITQRGPFQDGVNLIDEFLQPRIVQLIIRHNYRSRNAYQAGRQALVAVLDPHLQTVEGGQTTGTLRKYLMDGTRRDLACMPVQGPNFAPRGAEWQEWSYQEAIRFQGFDPVYTNPVQHSQVFAGQGTQLVGPMTGPIIGTTLDSIVTVNYLGTWKSYPTFTVLGPARAVLLENLTTGDQLFINYPLSAGQTMTVSLVQGAKSITLNDGTNLLGYVSTDSDLAEWHLTEANGGVNLLHAWASGVNASTLVTTYWYDKYLGI